MGKYPVVIENGSRRTFWHHFRLVWWGFSRVGGGKYKGRVSERKFERVREFCREKHLRFYTDNEYGRRSRDYRARFFRENPPLPGGFYFCAYCGIPHGRRRITVDHLYPVAKVSKDPALQKKLRRRRISDLNGPANLVPACHRCNAKKAAQMGAWIRKGRIGRHQWLWVFRWVIRLGVIFGCCYLCYRYLGGLSYVSRIVL